jgi:UDP-glucose 4-epimerase
MDVAERPIRRAAVVGGAGFIGRHLVSELAAAGVQITSIDRDPRGRLQGTGARSVQADIASGDHTLELTLGEGAFDAVFIAVGTGLVPRSLEHPRADLESNVFPLLAILDTLSSRAMTPVVVYTSSAAVYGESRVEAIGERHPTNPLSPYGVSKLAAEHYLRTYHRLYGIPGFSLRPFSVAGPGQRKLVVHDLLARLLSGEDPLEVRGAPEITRDYVSVGDVARCAHRLAAVAPARGEVYNLCTGVGTTLEELVAEMQAACGTTTDIRFTGTVRSGDPISFVGDGTAAAELGATCYSSLTSMIAATMQWLRCSSLAQGGS